MIKYHKNTDNLKFITINGTLQNTVHLLYTLPVPHWYHQIVSTGICIGTAAGTFNDVLKFLTYFYIGKKPDPHGFTLIFTLPQSRFGIEAAACVSGFRYLGTMPASSSYSVDHQRICTVPTLICTFTTAVIGYICVACVQFCPNFLCLCL
jgi:hypothetical protein